MSVTIFIIILTALVSIPAFNNSNLFNKLKFNAYMTYHKKEWYRLFSHGLLHANWEHIIFNMLTLYFFGDNVEMVMEAFYNVKMFPIPGKLMFLLFYISAIGIASIASLIKHKNNHYYNAVGASGAVSAILFAAIFFDPWRGVMLFLIPIPIPGFIFGALYLVYSHYMGRRGMDNIGHDAHFWGAIYGFAFPMLWKPELFQYFIDQLMNG